VTPGAIAAVEAIVKEHDRITVQEIAAHNGSAHHIHDVLQFHEVSARWVPSQMTAELRELVAACQELLKSFEAGYGLRRIVT
jgi:hypothetical protein